MGEAKNEILTVRIMPDDVSIRVESGTSLLEAIASAGIRINARCGGSGSCGRCRIFVREGECRELDVKTPKLTDEDRAKGVKLACRCEVVSDVVVEVPVESRVKKLAMTEKTATAGKRNVPPCEWESVLETGEHHPPVAKFYLELSPPSLGDNAADLTRLLAALKRERGIEAEVDYEVLKRMPSILREADWKVTASVLCEGSLCGQGGEDCSFQSCEKLRVIKLEPGDTSGKLFAVAIDVGTTSIHIELLDVTGRKKLGRAAEYNGQTAYGEDVISRIVYSLKDGHLDNLRKAAAGTVNELLSGLLKQASLSSGDISFMIAAGNTTMTQLLAGINPKFIREAPYVPAVNSLPWMTAAECGIDAPPDVPLYMMSCVASYVGGDIVSGVTAYGLPRRQEMTLYLDLGTNGEVVVGNSDWMMTASCSAGPAFEGGGLKCGMRAAAGAMQDFYIDPESGNPIMLTIGNEKIAGVCGSGIIALVAELLRHGIMSPNGKLNAEAAGGRVRDAEGGREYLLVPKEKAGADHDITVTESDLDNIIRAKAAVYAGCSTILEHVGLTFDMLDSVVLTGSFGTYVDIPSAIFIGLLPDLPLEKFCYIMNGSLLGARLACFSSSLIAESEKVARSMTNVELSEDSRFMDGYMAALFVPHTDSARFPSVAAELAAINGGNNK